MATKGGKSKNAWKYLAFGSGGVFIAVMVLVLILLFRVYGCAGDSFTVDTEVKSVVTGLCSDRGLHNAEILVRVLRALQIISLGGLVFGIIMWQRKK